MIDWLLNILFPKSKYFTGLIDDPRTNKEKERDYLHEEVLGATGGTYKLKADLPPPYPIESQQRTYSCVAHADTLGLAIMAKAKTGVYQPLSKAFVYRQRQNYPSQGMYADNSGNILVKKGSCLFTSLPTPLTEAEINQVPVTYALSQEAGGHKAGSYLTINNCTNIDVINDVVSRGTPVSILIYASYREWAREYPQLLDPVTKETAEVKHCVCVLPNSGFIENGKKHLMIQDSAPFGGISYRYLSEDFIRQRCFNAKYFTDLPILVPANKPKHTFTRPLKFGDNNEEVRWLQKCLAYEGVHPANATTGYFGGLTLASVNKFQIKYSHDILVPLGLSNPTGRVGVATIAQLNKLFG